MGGDGLENIKGDEVSADSFEGSIVESRHSGISLACGKKVHGSFGDHIPPWKKRASSTALR